MSADSRKVEIHSRQRLADDFFKLDAIVLRHQRLDGGLSPPLRRLCLERGDGVAALLYKKESRTLVLVRQFRYPAWERGGPGWLLEVVAGMIGQGQPPEPAMRREILEETGYQVDRLEHVSTFYLTPGGSTERIFLYYAEIGQEQWRREGGGLDEENEDIAVVELPVDAAWEKLDKGEILDAKTLVALLWFRARLQRASSAVP